MSKLELLIRQNKKRKEIENCKQQLTGLLGKQINEDDFLSLQQSDLLITKFYDSYKKSNAKSCEKYYAEDENLSLHIKGLRLKFLNPEGYLISKQTETCGLIKVPVDKLLEKYKEFIELDGDSICLLSTDEKEGIYIDYFEEANGNSISWYFEICFWKL